MTIGVYAGSFDPFTNGHLDIVKRSMSFCKTLYVALGYNASKKNMFGNIERVDMVHDSISTEINFLTSTNIKASYFSEMLVDYARKVGATVLIRGVRNTIDFEYETNLAHINKRLAPEIDTILLPTNPEFSIVSSSMVRELIAHKVDYSPFVPKVVYDYIQSTLTKSP